MRSTYNLDQPNPSKKERAGARKDAEDYLRVWKKRALYATVCVLPQLRSGGSFFEGIITAYLCRAVWSNLVYLTMALFVWLVISAGVAINSWFFLRALKKGRL